MRQSRELANAVTFANCEPPASMDLKIDNGKQGLDLHTDNYFAVPYLATNFTPRGELHPCADLKGMRIRATYQSTPQSRGQLLSVEIRK